jgi:polyketide biosynthesis acyl carrier protein
MLDQTNILNIIRHSVQDVMPNVASEQIILTNSLKDLGANSIDRAEIIMLTLRELKLKVPLMTFAVAKNIGDLVALMHRELASPANT